VNTFDDARLHALGEHELLEHGRDPDPVPPRRLPRDRHVSVDRRDCSAQSENQHRGIGPVVPDRNGDGDLASGFDRVVVEVDRHGQAVSLSLESRTSVAPD
jgi:hypothetical protein